MKLNTIRPAKGSRPSAKRVGRGIGSGLGKTCGRGHKGQRARAGGYHKVGFEGGQMPLQRRVPKFGFTSLNAKEWAELRLDKLANIDAEVIDLAVLKRTGSIPAVAKRVKIIASGTLIRSVTIRGIAVTKGARAAIEAAGGSVEMIEATQANDNTKQ
ncbi:MAG TPA: 50S ribosomal protein L15 [Gammaproteobacteria bacterium]|nr:50S ribosomal protein L15 [Gammaproteobacteria bacterium]